MSKVNTLLKLIAYQKQHPQAGDEEIAEGDWNVTPTCYPL